METNRQPYRAFLRSWVHQRSAVITVINMQAAPDFMTIPGASLRGFFSALQTLLMAKQLTIPGTPHTDYIMVMLELNAIIRDITDMLLLED
jgi:hypothetical protein